MPALAPLVGRAVRASQATALLAGARTQETHIYASRRSKPAPNSTRCMHYPPLYLHLYLCLAAHGVADLVAKNLYGILSWSMRFQVLKAGVRARAGDKQLSGSRGRSKQEGGEDAALKYHDSALSLSLAGNHDGGAVVNVEGPPSPKAGSRRTFASPENKEGARAAAAHRGHSAPAKSKHMRGKGSGKGNGGAGSQRGRGRSTSDRHSNRSAHGGKGSSTGRHKSKHRSSSASGHRSRSKTRKQQQMNKPDASVVALEAYKLVARALEQRKHDDQREHAAAAEGRATALDAERQVLQRWVLDAVTTASNALPTAKGAVGRDATAGLSDPDHGTMQALRRAAEQLDGTGRLVADVLSGKESRAVRHALAARVTSKLGGLLGSKSLVGGPRAGARGDMAALQRVLQRGLLPEAKAQAASINVLLAEPSPDRQAYMMLAIEKVAAQSGLQVVVWPVFSLGDAAESVRRGVPARFDAVYVSSQAMAAWLREQWERLSSGRGDALGGSSLSVGTGEDSHSPRKRMEGGVLAASTAGSEGEDGAFDMRSPMHSPGVRPVAAPPMSPDFASPRTRTGFAAGGGADHRRKGQHSSTCPSLVAAALARLLFAEGEEEPSAKAVNDTAIDLLNEQHNRADGASSAAGGRVVDDPIMVVYAPSEVAALREARLEHWDDDEQQWLPSGVQAGDLAQASHRHHKHHKHHHHRHHEKTRAIGVGKDDGTVREIVPVGTDERDGSPERGSVDAFSVPSRTSHSTGVGASPTGNKKAAKKRRARRGSGLTMPRKSPAGTKGLNAFASPATVSLTAGGRGRGRGGKRVRRGGGGRVPAGSRDRAGSYESKEGDALQTEREEKASAGKVAELRHNEEDKDVLEEHDAVHEKAE